ncbi:hypothetical protein LTR78_000105 [Recurvomyces mirabilis]|uniref:Zn(2)-C6 fungal-type domain-containing protein n=1 Tax=Recurvomyces mirabilis TaxID=574656 RepID=A0AAE1C697_9PEZI|nr:hypothetical protein LTR78_000105 [Recurvomyces mirabilis]KAK5161762.1 hypothetical protein LTS14_000107 [Recurvomyces mirabilis]
MPPAKRIRTSLTERACIECQKRKTKCLVAAPGTDAQSCAYCSKVGKNCVFVEPSLRTPLTRQNLDDAEARCARLEALLQRHCDANIGNPPSNQQSPVTAVTHAQHTAVGGNGPFEWSEAHDDLSEHDGDHQGDQQDGMAAFGHSSKGSGYLGGSSGHEMLQTVSSLLPDPNKVTSATLATPTSSSGHDYLGAGFADAGSLSSAGIEDQLINAYFKGYNAYYAVLHEQSFRKQCSRRRSIPPRSSWHIVYYAVLAIGEWISGRGGNEVHSLYYDAARARLTPDVLEAGSLDTIQAFTLLGNYLQKRDRPNTGYNYVGIALRMAMGLGLHRELPAASESTQMQRHRRRVLFWLLYSIDCWFNITTGRPALLSDTSYDVMIPPNIDETDLPLSSDEALDAAYPTTCSLTISLARLTRIANRIYGQFMCGSHAPDTISHQTTVLEQMLQDWQAALPTYFTSQDSPEWFLGPRQTVL